MDELTEVVYIADVSTYEMLYINEAGRRAFGVGELKGQKCYEVLQGRCSPCPFCTNCKLSYDESYTWKRANPLTGHSFVLKDRLIDWEGKRARIEIAFDTTTSDSGECKGLRTALDAEGMVLRCVHTLYEQTSADVASEELLRALGTHLDSDRAYLFVCDDGESAGDSYEWRSPGAESAMPYLRKVDAAAVSRWSDLFQNGDFLAIEDIESMKERLPEEYDVLARRKVKSLVVSPLNKDGETVGFVCVNNPQFDRTRNIQSLMRTLGYFYLATLRRIRAEKRLFDQSYRDELTGLHNRNRFIRDSKELEEAGKPLGVVFLDVNGLKQVNDRYGHTRGDALLRECARRMNEEAEGAELYRFGGDEFIALASDIGEGEFDRMVERLEGAFVRDEDSRELFVSVGSNWSEHATDINSMLAVADTRMYEQKRGFHVEKVLKENRLAKENPSASRFEGLGASFEHSSLLEEYNMLMSALHVSVSKHLFTEKFEVLWANDFYYEMTGYTREEYDEIFHSNCYEYFANDRDEYEKLGRRVKQAYATGKPGYDALLRMPQKGGNHLWIRVVGLFTSETVGGIPVIYSTFTSVADVVQMERERSIAFDNVPGFVARYRIEADGSLVLLFGNESFEEFFGPIEDVITNALFQKNLEANKEAIDASLPAMRKGEPVSFEIAAESVNGDEASFTVYGDCVDWIDGDPIYLAIYLDTTEFTRQRELTEKASNELRRVAFVDPVTGGPNRARFELDVDEEVKGRPAGTYVLVSVDLQKFKVINDLFGIEYGDRTLKFIYDVFASRIGEREHAARMADDRFSLLLEMTSEGEIEERLEEMMRCANDNIASALELCDIDRTYLITVKAGAYVISDPSLPIVQIQDRANVARKKAETPIPTGGRFSVCRFYRDDDSAHLAEEKGIENRMFDALEAGEFVVYLQPKVSLEDQRIAGAEALVRWDDPEKGLVSPDKFIPLFERNGFVVDLDLYVFERVCELLRSWIDRGVQPIPVSINFSRVHLYNPFFLERFESIRKAHGIPASLIELELTETIVFENPLLLGSVIDRLHEAGYRCSMDDFGSGYSSLNVLKNLPVDVLKLDRVFFETFDDETARSKDIIDIVIALARRLGMKTVAEGVETEEQASYLAKAGCDMIQGYLFSRPVPVEDFERLAFAAESAGSKEG